jgi:hypothetical protein
MAHFVARSTEFAGRFSVEAPIDAVFELFSPLGERAWVPGWNPELLHPPNAPWARGQIFRTREETGDAIWIVAELDHQGHLVEYYRVEPERYVVCVRVRCTPSGERRTDVSTVYAFVGLSDGGNSEIGVMTEAAYAEKMKRWEAWIAAHFGRRPRVQ